MAQQLKEGKLDATPYLTPPQMQTNRNAVMEFARGGLAALIVLGVFFTIAVFSGGREEKSSERFKVVDKYRYCDVVRYDAKDSARYAYFLDCNGSENRI
jgi:hypothetical protein